MQAIQLQDKAVDVLTLTILSSQTISDAAELFGTTAAIVEMPVAITGTSLTFEGSIDKGVTFKQIKDSSDTAITFTVAANGSYPLDTSIFAGYDEIKLVMVAQAADRSIKLKPFAL